MLRQFRIPLCFLVIGSLLGVFLRWQFISPTPGTNYSFFLHGHSHIMFLGWIFNALYLAFVFHFIEEKAQKFFNVLFLIIQALVVAMLISFPIQGYKFYSILFSTLHTLCALVFTIHFFRKTKHVNSMAAWYARIALLFFALSSAGPFSLGYLMANGLGATNWYSFSIYFYLHFQYNGFFFFGILSLLFCLLNGKNILMENAKIKLIGMTWAVACAPAYLLSTLWAKPGLLFHWIGAASALVQIIAFVMLVVLLLTARTEIRTRFSKPSLALLGFASTALGLKFVLQLLSAFPYVAQMAYEIRPIVIAYLHLMLVGVVTVVILVWYIEQSLISSGFAKRAVVTFIAGFIGMELVLIISPWWSSVSPLLFFGSSEYSFAFSLIVASSFLLLLMGSLRKTDKNQSFG